MMGEKGRRTVSDEAAVRRPRHVIGIKTLQLRRLDRATSRWLTASAGPGRASGNAGYRRMRLAGEAGRHGRLTDGTGGKISLCCSARPATQNVIRYAAPISRVLQGPEKTTLRQWNIYSCNLSSCTEQNLANAIAQFIRIH